MKTKNRGFTRNSVTGAIAIIAFIIGFSLVRINNLVDASGRQFSIDDVKNMALVLQNGQKIGSPELQSGDAENLDEEISDIHGQLNDDDASVIFGDSNGHSSIAQYLYNSTYILGSLDGDADNITREKMEADIKAASFWYQGLKQYMPANEVSGVESAQKKLSSIGLPADNLDATDSALVDFVNAMSDAFSAYHNQDIKVVPDDLLANSTDKTITSSRNSTEKANTPSAAAQTSSSKKKSSSQTKAETTSTAVGKKSFTNSSDSASTDNSSQASQVQNTNNESKPASKNSQVSNKKNNSAATLSSHTVPKRVVKGHSKAHLPQTGEIIQLGLSIIGVLIFIGLAVFMIIKKFRYHARH